MITLVCQRWRDRREHYRPAGEVVDTRRLEIVPTSSDTQVRAFIERHHYSGRYVAARRRFLVMEGEEVVGAFVYGQPCNDQALARLPDPSTSIELSRVVMLDRIGANVETWARARCDEMLRAEGFTGVLTFSDPFPRQTGDGRQVFAGHVGTIYQASNAIYVGPATARTLYLLPDGQVFSEQSLGKIRRLIRGWQYSAALLEQHGAAPLSPAGDTNEAKAWLRYWLPRVCRPVRHPGNLTYLMGLDRTTRRALKTRYGNGLPYPKVIIPSPAQLTLWS